MSNTLQESCVSTANLRGRQCDPEQPQLFMAGYRNGLLVMNHYKLMPTGTFQEIRSSKYQLGSTLVTFKVDSAVPHTALICCDSKLWKVTFDYQSCADPPLHRVWFTDADSVSHTSYVPIQSDAMQCLLVISSMFEY